MLKRLCLLIVFYIPTLLLSQPTSDVQLATHYFQNGEYEKAILYYTKIYEKNPSEIYYEALLKSYLETKNYKEAEKLVKNRIKSHGLIKYTIDLGHVYETSDDVKKAEKTYSKSIKDLEDNSTEVIKLANAFLAYRKENLALETYLKGRKLLKNGYPFNIEIAELYESMGNHQEMVKEYLDLLVINDAYLQSVQTSLENANALQKNSKQYEILRTELLRNIQKHPTRDIFSEMLIWLYLQEDNYKMALLQSKALDKRNKEDGERVLKIAQTAYNNKNYDAAIEGYEYVINKGNEGPYYQMAKSQQLSALRDKVTLSFNYTLEDLINLEAKYIKAIDEINRSAYAVSLIKDLASLQALYLNKLDEAIKNINKTFSYRNANKNLLAECKIDLADYLLLKNEIWDASLYYSQVEKDFKYDEIGERAKFKNAKISYYTGDFKWAKAQLDVLKGSTSKLIANDALWLSVLITDNTTADTNQIPLRMFARAELLIYQNKFKEAKEAFDSIQTKFPYHSLEDDILFQQYIIAYKRKEYETAEGFLQKIIDQFSEDILADNALFKLAELYENELNDLEKSKDLYLKLMKDYPGSLKRVEAQKRFRRLRGEEEIN